MPPADDSPLPPPPSMFTEPETVDASGAHHTPAAPAIDFSSRVIGSRLQLQAGSQEGAVSDGDIPGELAPCSAGEESTTTPIHRLEQEPLNQEPATSPATLHGAAPACVLRTPRNSEGAEGEVRPHVPAAVKAVLSPQEFREKVDRKIAYFETLARESRRKAQEDAEMEQSLQEARSRIQASAQKRKSLMHSAGREGNEGGCLGFGQPGSLSLDDLSASVGGGGALEARTLPHASVLDKDIACGAGACIADPVLTFNVPEETDVERRAVVSKGARAFLGISPVVEANTPDLSPDLSETSGNALRLDPSTITQELYHNNQKQLFGQDGCSCAENKSFVHSNGSVDEELAKVEEELAATLAKIEAEDLDSELARVEGELAELTAYNKEHGPSQGHSHTQDDVAKQAEVNSIEHQHPKSSPASTAVLQGSVSLLPSDDTQNACGCEDVVENAENTIHSATLKDADLNGSCSADSQNGSNLSAGSITISEHAGQRERQPAKSQERKRRAAEKRAAFLANMNRLMESTITADMPSTDGVGMEIASTSVENSEWVVQMEASAERVSSIASGEASFAGSTQTVPTLGDRMNGISPGCPQPQHNAGCISESTQVADMACSLSAGPDGTSKQDSPSSANTNHNEDGKCLATLNLPLLVQKKRKSFAPLSRVDPTGRQTTGMCSPCELSPEGKLDQCNGTAPVHETLAGIGVQVKRERGLVSIVDMMPGGPAAKVLKKGQVVLQIDGQSVSDLPIRDVLAKFRGRPGSVVLLSVVDGVAAHQAGQESRTVGIQRFSSVRSSQDRESLQKQNTSNLSVKTGSSDPHGAPIDVCGQVDIDSLHTKLLERLLGGSNFPFDKSPQQGTDPSSTGASPSARECVLESPEAARGACGETPRRCSGEMPDSRAIHEKFRLLEAAQELGRITVEPRSKSMGSMPAPTAAVVQKSVNSCRNSDFTKRVRSPGTAVESYKKARPSSTSRVNSGGSVGERPTRTGGPGKPAVPALSGIARRRSPSRSASAPRQRPFSQDRGVPSGTTRKTTRERVPIHIRSAFGRTLPTTISNTSSRPPFQALPARVHAEVPSTIEKRKRTLEPTPLKGSGRSSCRTRTSERGVDMKISVDDSLQVYADVGRAVTSLVQKLSASPNPSKRIPDKDEIMQVLGKLAAEMDRSTDGESAADPKPGGRDVSAARSASLASAGPALGTVQQTPARKSDVHSRNPAARQRSFVRKPSFDKENVGNGQAAGARGGPAEIQVDPVESGAEACGSNVGMKQTASASLYKQKRDSDLTFDAVLRSRFGVS